MSPAKRKPAPRARPASRKPAARTRARPQPRHRAAACTLTPRQLAGLFDRDDRAALLAHVPGCPGCAASLTVLSAQKEGLQHLTVAPAGGTAVERVLARGVRSGRRRLADLVYELAKACLVVVQDIDRRLHLATRPRDVEAIGRDVRAVGSRLPPREREEAAKLPAAKPDEARALAAAECCIRILEHVEGPSERQRLAWSVWLICSGRPAEAEGVLRGMVEGGASPHAFRNLLWALNRQGKFADSISIGKAAIRKYPRDWHLAYNVLVAIAWLGDVRSFKEAASHLRSAARLSRIDGQYRSEVLKFESARFAEALGIPTTVVVRELGVHLAEVGA